MELTRSGVDVHANVQVELVTTCVGWTRAVRAGFEVLCLGEEDENGIRGLSLLRLRRDHGQLTRATESILVRGVAGDLSPRTATIGRQGRFLVGTHRPSDRTGQVFELRRNGRAEPILALPSNIGPDFAVPRDGGKCRAWAGERGREDQVFFARDAGDPGVLVYSSDGVSVLDVDCARESVWLRESNGWRMLEVDSGGVTLGEHPTGELYPHPLAPWVIAEVDGRCSVGAFGTDLRVYCGHEEVGSRPFPTQVGDHLQLGLSKELERGGFIAWQSTADPFVLVHEVASDGWVGEWLRIPIPGGEQVVVGTVVANRSHVCVSWTLPRAPHTAPLPVTLACIPRP